MWLDTLRWREANATTGDDDHFRKLLRARGLALLDRCGAGLT